VKQSADYRRRQIDVVKAAEEGEARLEEIAEQWN
jgi:hypothetical protein